MLGEYGRSVAYTGPSERQRQRCLTNSRFSIRLLANRTLSRRWDFLSQKDSQNWLALNRTATILSIVTGVGFCIQVALALDRMVDRQVPFWIVLSSSATCLVFGFFLSRRFRKRSPPQEIRNVGQIRFDYLPGSPTDHGWTLHLENPAKTPPTFCAPADAPVAGAICIESQARYFLEYELDESYAFANVIEYFAKPTRDGPLYLKVRLTARDKSNPTIAWLRHVVGKGNPSSVNPKEWTVEVNGPHAGNGWISLSLDLASEVAETFGKQGFVFDKVLALRIRGSISLSPILFRHAETSQEKGQRGL